MKTRLDKPCQWSGCAHVAVLTERFCLAHRKQMIRRMEADGYLQEIPGKTPRRPDEAKENRRETKYGVDK
jgi:hypothetical protein